MGDVSSNVPPDIVVDKANENIEENTVAEAENSENETDNKIAEMNVEHINETKNIVETVNNELTKSVADHAITIESDSDAKNHINIDPIPNITQHENVVKDSNEVKNEEPNTMKQTKSPIDLQRNDSILNVFKNIEAIRSTKNVEYLKLSNTETEFDPTFRNWRLNSERLLILDLLTMNYAQREKYLLDKAVKNRLLIQNKNSSELLVSPEMMTVSRETFPAIEEFKQKFSSEKLTSPKKQTMVNTTQISCEFCESSSSNCLINKFLCTFNASKKAQNKTIQDYFQDVKCLTKRNENTEKEIAKLYAKYNASTNEETSLFSGKFTAKADSSKTHKIFERKRGGRGKKHSESQKDCHNEIPCEINGFDGKRTMVEQASDSPESSAILGKDATMAGLGGHEDNAMVLVQNNLSDHCILPNVINVENDGIQEDSTNNSNNHAMTDDKELITADSIEVANNTADLPKKLIKKIRKTKQKINEIKEKMTRKKDGMVLRTENTPIKKETNQFSCTISQNTDQLKGQPKNPIPDIPIEATSNCIPNPEPVKVNEEVEVLLDTELLDKDIVTSYWPKTSSNEPFILNDENLLIAQLLTLDQQQQDELIINLSKKHDILINNVKCWTLNPKLHSIQCFNDNLHTSLKIDNKTAEKQCFQYAITNLLNDHGINVRKYVSNCALLNVIDTPRNLPHLVSLAEQLKDENVGYIIEGSIRVNENDNEVAYVKNPNGLDVRFQSMFLRQAAMHDDIVQAFVLHKNIDKSLGASSQPNPKGFVINILKEVNTRMIVGKMSKRLFIEPTNKRITWVRIPKETLPKNFKLQKNVFYSVKIVKILENLQHIGKVVEVIGKCNSLSSYNKVILKQYDLQPNEYNDDILNSLPPDDFVIPENEYKNRKVLTKECIFTIDPETAKDLDDALSCRILANGNYEIGVHISDVTYFLKENTKLDDMVRKMTTSIYMVDTVYHMLPKPLCTLCSLLPGTDKLSFSALFEITPDGIVEKTLFTKTIINSCVQLSYSHAQKLIDCDSVNHTDFPPILNDFTICDVQKAVKHLHIVAMKLRQKRFDNGALRFDQPKISFDLHPDTKKPIAFQPCQQIESNFLIEEFMLLANQSVAKFCYENFSQTTILRNHAKPDHRQMSELRQRLENAKFMLDVTDAKSIALSYQTIMEKCDNVESTKSILNKMLAKPMVRAEYFCSAQADNDLYLEHFALAMPIYTHFTSPIRRYPDCLVHRVLSAALNLEPPSPRTPDTLQIITTLCNRQKYNAKLAGEDCGNLYFIEYVKSIESIRMRAAVFDINEFIIQVVLILTGHRINIRIKDQQGLIVTHITNESCMAEITFDGDKNRKIIKLFSEIDVDVFVSRSGTLKATIVPPEKESSCL